MSPSCPTVSGWSPTAWPTSPSVSSRSTRGPDPRLFVGRLEARKGVDSLLESAVLLVASGDDFELRLVGDASLEGSLGADLPGCSNATTRSSATGSRSWSRRRRDPS